MSSSVLLVDDERGFLEHLSKSLSDEGLAVTATTDGEDAIESCSKEDFDLLITDLRLPGRIDGWDVIESARRRNPSIDSMTVTAYPLQAHKARAEGLNVFAYMEKPLPISHILNNVRWCLQRRQLEADIDSLRVASQAPLNGAATIQALFNTFPYPLMVLSDDGSEIIVNDLAKKALGACAKSNGGEGAFESSLSPRSLLDAVHNHDLVDSTELTRIRLGGRTYRARAWRVDDGYPTGAVALLLEPQDTPGAALLDSDTARVWLPILMKMAR
ncbi:MAG: response regulator [Candidatus Zixiibacteriota bacterium]